MRRSSTITVFALLLCLSLSSRAEAMSRLRCGFLVAAVAAASVGATLTVERGEQWKDAYVAWREARAAEAQRLQEEREAAKAEKARLKALADAEQARAQAAEQRLILRNRVVPFVDRTGRPYTNVRTATMRNGDVVLFMMDDDECVVWTRNDNEYRSLRLGTQRPLKTVVALMAMDQNVFALLHEPREGAVGLYHLVAIPWETADGSVLPKWKELGPLSRYFTDGRQLFAFDATAGSIVRAGVAMPLENYSNVSFTSLGITGVKSIEHQGNAWHVVYHDGRRATLADVLK